MHLLILTTLQQAIIIDRTFEVSFRPTSNSVFSKESLSVVPRVVPIPWPKANCLQESLTGPRLFARRPRLHFEEIECIRLIVGKTGKEQAQKTGSN